MRSRSCRVAGAHDQQVVRPLPPLCAQQAFQAFEPVPGPAIANPSVAIDPGNPLHVAQRQVRPDGLVEVIRRRQLQILHVVKGNN